MEKEKEIVHVDMDAFFAAIEQRDNPSFAGKPVVVGADPKGGKGRGVVSTCSYEARRYGIHSAMPISVAFRKCPSAVFLPVNMEKYARCSSDVFRCLNDFTPDVEPVSIDEAFLDISGSSHLFGGPEETCLKIKEAIKKKTALTASVGLAPIKMAAKIASDLCKPDGFLHVKKDKLEEFLNPLDISRIWGIGPKLKEVLNSNGIFRIGDISSMSLERVTGLFGRTGEHLWYLSRGIDGRAVECVNESLSVSNEHTFETDTGDVEVIKATLMALSDSVSSRLRKEKLSGKTITLKIRLEGFHTYTRQMKIDPPTSFVDQIYGYILRLFEGFGLKGQKVRLLGVKVSGLSTGNFPNTLFDGRERERTEKIHSVVDKIRDIYGDEAIFRARGRR